MLDKMNESEKEKMSAVIKEIFDVFTSHRIMVSEAAGVLGSILGVISCQTEENFPFISFLNSFTRSYHANYSGKETHHVSDDIKPWEK